MLSILPPILLWMATLTSSQHGAEESQSMGPVAFMFPTDRTWGAEVDNTPPCGSASGVVNRTAFPLINGQIAMVIQDDSWQVEISISYSENPTSNDEFTPLIQPSRIPDVDPGHECYPLPNPPSSIISGTNATLQVRYTSDFDTDVNETYYACADITYIPVSEFTYQVPCFNTSSDTPVPEDDGDDSATATATTTASTAQNTATSGSSTSGSTSSSGGGGGGLMGGAIAGIVIGSLAGAAIVIGGAFYIWRLRSQKERLREQQASQRAVKWDPDASSSGSKNGNEDIALRDMGR